MRQPSVIVVGLALSAGLALNLSAPLGARAAETAKPADAAAAGSHGAEALLAAVGSGATLLQLSEQLDRSSTELLPQLLALELSGRLQAQPGLCWRPA